MIQKPRKVFKRNKKITYNQRQQGQTYRLRCVFIGCAVLVGIILCAIYFIFNDMNVAVNAPILNQEKIANIKDPPNMSGVKVSKEYVLIIKDDVIGNVPEMFYGFTFDWWGGKDHDYGM